MLGAPWDPDPARGGNVKPDWPHGAHQNWPHLSLIREAAARLGGVDDHQRQMWSRMLEPVDDLCAGRLDLAQLVSDLWGLFVEADPHDPVVREDFESMWSPIDNEYELRTAPWAPPGLASDENLEAGSMTSELGAARPGWDTTGLHG